jgi:predicted dithiol-disulfide oxidoreductase (DUF899 family)
MRKIVARQHGSASCQPVRVSEDSSTVSLPEIVSREQWLVARKELLAEEKPPSYGGDFNYDFHVTLDESVAPVEYNYRDAQEWRPRGSSSSRVSCTARAPSCATANASFTPARPTGAAPSRSAARTTTST